MATLSQFFPSHKLIFSTNPSLSIHHRHQSLICAAIKKPRASRKVKSNVDLYNDIKEFLSVVGLPEDHVPTTKELSHHGRQDLANIVRRRGYKLLRELLSSSSKTTYDVYSGEGGPVETCADESLGQDGNKTDLTHGMPLPSKASAVDAYMTGANNDDALTSEEKNYGDQESSVYSSLEETVANFIQNGELDSVEDSGSENINERGSEEVEGFIERQNVVETEISMHKEHKDPVLCNIHGAEISNGNSAPSTQHVEHPDGESFQLRTDNLSTEDLTMAEETNSADIETENVENQAEMNRLKFMLHQKELELTHLKRQVEEEKHALSILQTKVEREISKAQKLISEKDAELNAAEESLSGLKEVEVQYWANGERVEVAGSFNGWHHKVKMDLQASSIIDPIDQDLQASSNIIDPIGMRKPQPWKTVLWLYPGIYEIKFVVDGHWTIDPQRELVTRGAIQNNVLRVER